MTTTFFFGRWKRERRGCLWLFFPLSKKKVKKSEKRKKKYERPREKE